MFPATILLSDTITAFRTHCLSESADSIEQMLVSFLTPRFRLCFVVWASMGRMLCKPRHRNQLRLTEGRDADAATGKNNGIEAQDDSASIQIIAEPRMMIEKE